MSFENDTIAAIATPSGRGGIGIIRISGPLVKTLCQTLVGTLPTPRYASFHTFKDLNQNAIDQGLILFFEGPHSFTGEDVLELQGHGGPVILDQLLECILNLGARLAQPGEFSQRAFLNNKIDLTQAEAIADLIDAQSQQAARCAMRSLQGEFSQKIHALVDLLIRLRTHVEACIDFPEEEIDFLKDNIIREQLEKIIATLHNIIIQTQQGVILKEGLTLVIAGPPNVGKSSLMNYFTKQDSAIVSPQAGTTRDIIKETIKIAGIPIHLLDTAGLRDSDDFIEQEGIKRAKQVFQKADLLLYMISLTENNDPNFSFPHLHDPEFQNIPKILIINKIDLTNQKTTIETSKNHIKIFISIKQNIGLDLLEQTIIKTCLPQHTLTEGNFTARRRHVLALSKALETLKHGQNHFYQSHAGDLLAEDLRVAQLALSSITGEFHSDDLLGEIFSNFCIGK